MKLTTEKGVVLLLIICIFIYGFMRTSNSVESYGNSNNDDYADVMSQLSNINKTMSLENADLNKVLAHEEVLEDEKLEQKVVELEELDEPSDNNCIKDDDYTVIFKHKILDPYVYKE